MTIPVTETTRLDVAGVATALIDVGPAGEARRSAGWC
jgi:hypothetical protein